MQACYAADIAQCSAAIQLDSCKITIYIQDVQVIMGWIHVNKEICLLEHIPNLVLKKVWASLVTGNMVLSVHAASTIGFLTCRWFYGSKISITTGHEG